MEFLLRVSKMYRRRKERGFDRSSCSLHPRRVNALVTIAQRTHLRDRLPQALTHPVASHTCDIREDTETTRRCTSIHAHGKQDPQGSRSPIADRTRWNLTRSARTRARASQKPVGFQAAPRKTSRQNENGIAQRTRQWCSSMSSGMIPRSLRSDSCGYNMQSRLCADLY